MQKYFISDKEMQDKMITSDDVFHISNVMRCRVNDQIIVSNEDNEYLVYLTQINKHSVTFAIIKEINGNSELPFFVSLYQGFPKGDKMEDIIKHSVELGITEVYPTFTKRSNYKLDKDKYSSKLIRYNKIAKEASEQSNRQKLAHVVEIMELEKVNFSAYNCKIVCYEESAKENEISHFKSAIKGLKMQDKLCVVIGPEGGLTTDEVLKLEKEGFLLVGLGPRILRTETAIMYVLSAISYEWELK